MALLAAVSDCTEHTQEHQNGTDYDTALTGLDWHLNQEANPKAKTTITFIKVYIYQNRLALFLLLILNSRTIVA